LPAPGGPCTHTSDFAIEASKAATSRPCATVGDGGDGEKSFASLQVDGGRDGEGRDGFLLADDDRDDLGASKDTADGSPDHRPAGEE
jgi:hypothetical protein